LIVGAPLKTLQGKAREEKQKKKIFFVPSLPRSLQGKVAKIVGAKGFYL
jgi:hypothetical protein